MSDNAAVAHDDHHYTSTGLNSWKMGFWAFMGSECLFFGTLISTYMVYKGASVSGPLPHEILDIPLTTISTFVLLMSSLAMVLALDGVQRGSKKLAMGWLMAVIVLGITFLGFQAYEFNHFVHEGLTIPTECFRIVVLRVDRLPRGTRYRGCHLDGDVVCDVGSRQSPA